MADTPKKYGKKRYRALLGKEADKVDRLVPYVANAVKRAEGNPRNFGVLSMKTSGPQEADTILRNSIVNNFARWREAGSPGKFVDFMQQRWAPIGVSNDPRNLNINWAPNVRKSLLQQLGPEQYNVWRAQNLVLANNGDLYA